MSSPVKAKPKPKKTKVTVPKSPIKKVTKSPAKKDGDIRALFSTTTKSTTSYTKLINDLGIPNDGSIPTRLINLLVDLNLDNSSTEKTCYICQNMCNCNMILDLRKHRKKPMFPVKLITDPKLPDLDLIDDIDIKTILECAKNDSFVNIDDDIEDMPPVSFKNNSDMDVTINNSLNNDTLNNQREKLSDKHNCSNNFDLEFDFGTPDSDVCIVEKTPERKNDDAEDNKNCNNNFDLEFDFDSLDRFDMPEIKLEKKEVENIKDDLDKNFEIGDIEDIFAESSPEEVAPQDIAKVENVDTSPKNRAKEENADPPKEALGFFGLDSIDDIFADYDDSIEVKPSETRKETIISNSIRIKEEDKVVKPDTNNIKPFKSQNPEVKAFENPVSPSILSGRQRNIITTSPILCTQKRKFQLSTRKPISSTPASSARRQLIKSSGHDSNVDKNKSTISNALHESNDKSMFTITQLIQMINNPDDKSKCNQSSFARTNNNFNVTNDDERSTSPILLTQADRKKVNNTGAAADSKLPTTQMNKSVSLIVLESDSDSCNDTQEYDLDEEIKLNHKTSIANNTSPINSKRKLDIDDDVMSASPYFNKKPKLDNTNSKPLTLQEKVLAALKSNKADITKPSSNDRVVNFSFSPRKAFSQKENKDPQIQNGDTQCGSDDDKEIISKRNLEMLQMFRRDSKILSPKDEFNLITSNHTKGLAKSQKRKLTFDDSDDDFVNDKTSKNQKPVNDVDNKFTANHKKRKVSSSNIHKLLLVFFFLLASQS